MSAVPTIYQLTARNTEETYPATRAELHRILGVEPAYIDWVIQCDGSFANGDWTVQPGRSNTPNLIEGNPHGT